MALTPRYAPPSPYRGTMTSLDRWAAYPYVSLTTFRRDGIGVATPVWVVRDGDRLAVFTAADSHKVRRLRRNPAVTLAPCTARGRVVGPAVAGRATVAGSRAWDRVTAALVRKHGLLARLMLLASRVRSGRAGTVVVHVAITDEEATT